MFNGSDDVIFDYDALLQQLNVQEVYQMLPVIFFYALILTIGLFGNLLVLIVYTFRYKRSQARGFILFLATNDFLMCLFGLPYQLIDMVNPYTYTYGTWCKVSSFIVLTLFHISVFGLVVIAVDRYTKICHPLGKFHTQYFGKRRACVIAVILGVLLSWPILILYGPSEMDTGVQNITGYACYYEYADPESNYVLIYSMTTLCFCVGSTICLIVLYSLVFCKIYSRYQKGISLRSIQQHAEDSTCLNDDDEKMSKSNPTENSKNSHNVQFTKVSRYDKIVTLPSIMCKERDPKQKHLNSNINRPEISDPSETDSETDEIDCARGLIKESDTIEVPIETKTNASEIDNSPQKENILPALTSHDNNACNVTNGSHELQANKFISKTPFSSSKRGCAIQRTSIKDPLVRLCMEHPEICRTRSRSYKEPTRGRQNERLSLPMNSLTSASSKSSLNSRKDSINTSQKSVLLGREGLRMHCSTNNMTQRCSNATTPRISRGHSKITKIMITITSLFILSYTPTLIIIIWSNLRPEIWDIISIHETLVFEFCLRFYLINNICNPFIYGFWDKRFKREVVFSMRKLAGMCLRCKRYS